MTVENVSTETDLQVNDATEIPNKVSCWGPIVRKYRAIPTFTLSSGIKTEVAALIVNDILGGVFETILYDKVISLIVDQTKHYTTCLLLEKNDVGEYSRFYEWTLTRKTEIKKFIPCSMDWFGKNA